MSWWWWRFRLCVYRRYNWNHNDFQTVRSWAWGFRLTACSVSLVGSFSFSVGIRGICGPYLRG